MASQVLLTWRYADAVRTFLAEVRDAQPIGGRGHFLSSAFLGGPFATPWRLEQGPLLDLGPHVIDLLDAALGTVTSIRAYGDVRTWVGLLLEHESGLSSEVSLSGSCPVEPARSGVEIYTRDGVLEVDTAQVFHGSTFARVVDEFVDHLERPGPHALDAHRGLHLQRLLTAALDDL